MENGAQVGAVLRRADELLADESCWSSSRERTRQAVDGKHTLYSALAVAAFEVSGAFDHRDPALELVRELIVQQWDREEWNHRLADFNADSSFAEVKDLLRQALASVPLT